jgi:hypothetical protein
MKTERVFRHFGGVQANVCRVLGLGRATVNAWQKLRIGSAPPGLYVPEICAWRLHYVTRGRLPINPKLYDRLYNRKPIPYETVRKSIQAKATRRHKPEVQSGVAT